MSTIAGSSRDFGISSKKHCDSLGKSKERDNRPDYGILEQNEALRDILSSSSISQDVPENSTTHSGVNFNSTIITKKNQAVKQLKGAVKCSLAQLLDINISEKGINPSGVSKPHWTPINLLKLNGPHYLLNALITIPVSGSESLNPVIHRQRRHAPLSLVVHSPSSTKSYDEQFDKNDCHFELKNVLIESRAYTVEVAPNYNSLKGRPLTIEINANSIDRWGATVEVQRKSIGNRSPGNAICLPGCHDDHVANSDGTESCVTRASAIQVVFTELANNRGNVTAMKVGVVCFAIEILTTAPITNPARTAALVLNTDQGSYTCTCPAEYTGTDCELVKDDCTVIPCLNGGTCSDQPNTTFSLVVHSPSSTKFDDEQFDENDCHFELKNVLIECRAYTIELVPNYDSLKGRPLTIEINANSIDMESMISVAASSNSLNLNWKDNSGCAPQLTSFYLKTMIDGKVNAADVTNLVTNGSLKIPRTCLKRQRDEINAFSLVLSADGTCPVEWTTLDSCRKYSFEMKSEYSILGEVRRSSPKDNFYGIADCPNPGEFSCSNSGYGSYGYFKNYGQPYCLSIHHICDGQNHCDYGFDEQNCASSCSNGFKCGRQCIPKEKICDGVYDCIDGSDEHYECEYSKSCSELTDTKGSFSSQTINSDGVFKNASKSIVAISVQSNHTIWLSFNEFNTTTNHSMNIYDGPYSTSPLLLSHSGSTNPPSIRSSSNNLYVEFPSYYDKSYGVSVSYTSMESTGKPFIPGCGGYVNGDGLVSSPNYLTDDDDIDECYWFVEARQSDGIVCLKRNGMTDLVSNSQLPNMTVYDGWNTSGNVLYYDDFVTSNSAQTKGVVYSNSEKIMVRFTRPKVSGNNRAYWSVKTVSTVQTTTDLVGMVGTIRSPNYPASYPNSSDYRWKIVTQPNTSIRLLFAFFETQEKFDFVSFYDGPTVNSRLLLEKSGLSTTPFTVNSSSNEMLVRFTTDETITLSGFLAVYSTVIVIALASQKNEIIAPITAILEQNEALRDILSSPISQDVPENSTTHPGVNFNSTIITNIHETIRIDEEKQAVKQLRGAKKKSILQGVSKPHWTPINLLKLNGSPLSAECIDYNSGVWIRVFESGNSSSEETYLSIPRKCLKDQPNTTFSLVVVHSPSSTKFDDEQFDENDCHFELKNVLIECRAYTIELVPNYDSLKGRPLTTEIVIPSTVEYIIHNSDQNIHHICDGQNHCDYEFDEQNCASSCTNGFKCGRQCIPKEEICNGVYDCIDGSDEHYDCEYSKSCSELTDTKGSFSSQTFDYYEFRDVFKKPRKSIVAISVQSNHTIWLSFNGFNTTRNHSMKIYDGPYSTSPLLLSHSGSTNPPSIRSSSNNLYVEFPSYYDKSYGVSVSYTSMESTGKPFVPECGGYVNGDGVVSSPNYLSDDEDIDDCFWFVEARQSDSVVYLKRNFRFDNSLTRFPIITVYDGWNISGQVLYYDESITTNSTLFNGAIYSISERMMVRFTRSKVSGSGRIHWDVTTIPTAQTTTDFVGMVGTIRSPNYPASYPNSSDYRWKIVTQPNTSIRLLFAFFETQEKFDFVSVYDGPTVNSRLLLEKSGLSMTPFTVNSCSNEMLVRFTTDETITLPGFLALYSTV
uniref:CUB domain-containing protein n=1 Tax=Daphnia galeata TaxID=27404 RepID=A0A8J2WKJ6_9CRUS|nr:unnamed protein product [Daphnia galeata]